MKLRYRPEIDGLRAIAVFSVIIYHAKFFFNEKVFLKGGFIGVDIFLVISGYLITSLILKEYKQTNFFSYKYFYERRARRILPALLFIIIVSSVIAYLFLLPLSFVDFAYSSISSILFSSNIYFWATGIEYAATSELYRPLLHTWSLSIEEQFYIVFPIFLIFLLKNFERNILKIVIFFFIISLIFATYGNNKFQSLNFYIIFSRGWELLAGSLLSICELKFGNKKFKYPKT